MAISNEIELRYRYAPLGLLGPYSGWWEGVIVSQGDATGGNHTLTMKSTAPQHRIHRIDNVFVKWDTAVGASNTVLKMGLSAWREDGFTQGIVTVDMSGATIGDLNLPIPNGWMWRTNNEGDEIVEWSGANANLNNVQVVATGLFYEGKAGETRVNHGIQNELREILSGN